MFKKLICRHSITKL